MRRPSLLIAAIVLALGMFAMRDKLVSRPATSPDYVHFESGQVHPLALTPSHDRLLALSTSDNHLMVFDLTNGVPERIAQIPVGLEPVSVAALDDSTAWVVNNISDDVSIVNLNTLHVRATLRVGDEPNDVVFAGGKAYVSVTAEDCIKVYDASTRALVTRIAVPGRAPRALARNAAGTRVEAAMFMSGNRTSILSAAKVPDDSIPQETESAFFRDSIPGHGAPKTGFIVEYMFGNWNDMYGNLWNSKVKYSLTEVGVAEINTATDAVVRSFSGTGSVNYNIAVSPTDGRIAVSSTLGRNRFRFEPRLIGYLVETQASFISFSSGAISIRKLDLHINYDVVPGTQAEADSAIGIPSGIAIAGDGSRTFVTSLATNKLAVLNTFGGPSSTVLARIPTLAGPTGIVVDDARGQVYILGRFHNQIQTLATNDFHQVAIASIGMDPAPDAVINGRKFFYGGSTSSHGDQACATCHIFGDVDGLSWDLGNPHGGFVPPPVPNPLGLDGADPMKGPMATQSLRGMTNTEPLHWRGDRADISAFKPAFSSLMGRATALPDSEMQAFADFVMPLAYPPNPHRYLDRTLPDAPSGQGSAQRGETFFLNTPVQGSLRCNDCHTASSFGPGTNRLMVSNDSIGEVQDLKVPQLRNLYKKTGFNDSIGVVNRRGFGFGHEGAFGTLFSFLQQPRFDFGSPPSVADDHRRDVEAYLRCFDTGMAPAVGFQITFDGTNNTDATEVARMDTLQGQAALDYCDLIAKGRVNGIARGWEYLGGGMWKPDLAAAANISSADLRALGDAGSEVTVTGVPKGSGHRMGVDRDRDGYLDGDEVVAGSDPGNALSNPTNVGVRSATGSVGFALRSVHPNPFRASTEIAFTLGRASRVSLTVYDVLGREVQRVARGVHFDAGAQTLRWDGRNASGAAVSTGVYFMRLETEGGHWTRPAVRIH